MSNYDDKKSTDLEDYSLGPTYSTDKLMQSVENERDAFFLVQIALAQLLNSPKYSTSAELFYLLDRKSLLNLLSYYGGKTITLPSKDELLEALNYMTLYYYYEVQGLSFQEALDKTNLPKVHNRRYQVRYKKFLDSIDHIKLPKSIMDIEKLKESLEWANYHILKRSIEDIRES